MMLSDEPVQCPIPVFDCGFMPGEIHQLVSLFQAGFQANTKLGSEAGRPICSAEERKRRRMISNRESARRSRWKKKRRLEELTDQVNRLRLENRELKNRLCLVSHQCQVVSCETDWLLMESQKLQDRLAGLCQILIAQTESLVPS
ncbi:hypothetical protein NMG60_11031261 [Bertholletia excelsa]